MYLDDEQEAQLHKEIYAALVRSAIRTRITEAELARQLRVSTVYITNILDPFDRRLPGPELAEQIVQAIRAEPEIRETILYHMALASERRLRAHDGLRKEITERSASELLKYLRHMANAGEHQAKARYYAVREASSALIRFSDPRLDTLTVVELYSLLQHYESILNRHADGLFHAKAARYIMLGLDRADYHRDAAKFDRLFVNTIRIEAVSYHNLGLFREDLQCCREAGDQPEVKRQIEYWIPRLNLDEMNALIGIPRFTIQDIAALADQGKKFLKERDPTVSLLLDRAVADAYLRHGTPRKAIPRLPARPNDLDRIPGVGALDRTIILKTGARLQYSLGDRDAGEAFLRAALKIDLDSGFEHQTCEILSEFGAAAEHILAEHGSGELASEQLKV